MTVSKSLYNNSRMQDRRPKQRNRTKFVYIVLAVITLVAFWALYLAARTFGGNTLISDETFFVYQDINAQNKRILFLTLVQSFSDWEEARYVISTINIIAVIFSYLILRPLFFDKDWIVVLYLLYLTAVSNYIFRDSMLFLLVAASTYCLMSENKYFKLGLLVTLPLMYDFRPHYLVFLAAAYVAATIAKLVTSNKIFVFFGFVFVVGVFFSLNYLGENVMIYGISASDYLETKEQRYSKSLNAVNFVTSFATHYLAPLPTSLLERAIVGPPVGEPLSPYGDLDDVYRLVYKTFLYGCFVYIALNMKHTVTVIDRFRFNFVFFLVFSLCNAVLYSAVNFGGGHERIKMFSTFVVFYTVAAIIHLKSEKSVKRLNPRLQASRLAT